MARLKDAFTSEAAVRAHFAAQRVPGPGPGLGLRPAELDRREFAALALGLGLPLGPLGLDAAMGLIDADQNGTVSQAEFLEWWLVDL